MPAVELGIIDGYSAFQIIKSCLELPGGEMHDSHRAISLDEVVALSGRLAESNRPLRRCPCRRELGGEHVMQTQAMQHDRAMRCAAPRSAQVAGLAIHGGYL